MGMTNKLDGVARDEMTAGRGLVVWIARLVAFLAGVALAMCLAGCKHIPWDKIPMPDKPPEQSADAVPYESLRWVHGGFNGPAAVLDDVARIDKLNVHGRGMSYRWTAGGCERFGAANAQDYTKTVACIFYRGADGVWRGGKFDWISTSRTTRDFHNVDAGYGGWSRAAFDAGTAYAFVIVGSDMSAGGRPTGRRTNVVIVEGRL